MLRARRRTAATVAMIAASLALAACGDDGSETSAETPGGFDGVVGKWSGTLEQADTKPFPIEVTIASEDDPKSNVVWYGGEIDCSGNWTFEGEQDLHLIFREVIDSGGGGRCKGVGTVTLTPTDEADRLGYAFRGGGVQSTGILSREG